MLLFILRKQTEARNGTQISKHLMLLFIKLKKLYELYATKFQNISCYCLSFLPRIQTFDLRDFKTSHVIVYLLSVCSFDRKYFISKHLMLLFIPRISAFFSFSPPLFPLIFSIFLHFVFYYLKFILTQFYHTPEEKSISPSCPAFSLLSE